MIRIEAPSRLHFGLLSLPGQVPPSANATDSVPRRHFGGVGLMIDQPGIALSAAPAAAWAASGPSAERALSFAKLTCERLQIKQAFAVRVERCPPEHIGLGTGTQLGLATARAIAIAAGHGNLTALELAKLIGRGRRSAIGIHGFDHGGFLVEGGKCDPEAISPLIVRQPFPEQWSILLATPRSLRGDYGQRELEAFGHLEQIPANIARTDRLCRLVLMNMLPALVERDLDAFGEALYEFNRGVGEMFQPWQGDIYAHPEVDRLISGLRDAGVKGVGHSSWGPTVFAIVLAAQARELSDWVSRRHRGDDLETTVTNSVGHGARLVNQ